MSTVVMHSIVGALNQSNMSMCQGHAGCSSFWWMWCYRSTKALCCPIQQGIEARITGLWRGLWYICASGSLISANRKGSNGWPQLSADSSIVWGQFGGAGFVGCILGSATPTRPSVPFKYHRLISHLGTTQVIPQLQLIKIRAYRNLAALKP